MVEDEPFVLVEVERRAVELVGRLAVEVNPYLWQLDDLVAVVSPAWCGETKSEGAASTGEGDTKNLVRPEVALDGVLSGPCEQ